MSTNPAITQLTARTILKREILIHCLNSELEYASDNARYREALSELKSVPIAQTEAIESFWDELEIDLDANEFRVSGIRTGIKPRFDSRYYGCAEVGKPVTGFSDLWVGWTYWYGGGKHGEPGAEEWIESAYLIKSEIELRPTIKFCVFDAETPQNS
jgi:hypothetical protein